MSVEKKEKKNDHYHAYECQNFQAAVLMNLLAIHNRISGLCKETDMTGILPDICSFLPGRSFETVKSHLHKEVTNKVKEPKNMLEIPFIRKIFLGVYDVSGIRFTEPLTEGTSLNLKSKNRKIHAKNKAQNMKVLGEPNLQANYPDLKLEFPGREDTIKDFMIQDSYDDSINFMSTQIGKSQKDYGMLPNYCQEENDNIGCFLDESDLFLRDENTNQNNNLVGYEEYHNYQAFTVNQGIQQQQTSFCGSMNQRDPEMKSSFKFEKITGEGVDKIIGLMKDHSQSNFFSSNEQNLLLMNNIKKEEDGDDAYCSLGKRRNIPSQFEGSNFEGDEESFYSQNIQFKF